MFYHWNAYLRYKIRYKYTNRVDQFTASNEKGQEVQFTFKYKSEI